MLAVFIFNHKLWLNIQVYYVIINYKFIWSVLCIERKGFKVYKRKLHGSKGG